MDIHKYKHRHICAYIYIYTYIHIHLIIYTYMRRLHPSPREPCEARWRCIFAWSAAWTWLDCCPGLTGSRNHHHMVLKSSRLVHPTENDEKILNPSSTWNVRGWTWWLEASSVWQKNESSLEPEWGAGIDTPKYSGIRKMSEVVVRVNNAWAR